METLKWYLRFVFWLPIFFFEEIRNDNSSLDYIAKAFASIAMGVVVVLIGFMALVSPWFEGVRFISFFPCLVLYFIIGALTYFLNKNTNDPNVPWQRNGPW